MLKDNSSLPKEEIKSVDLVVRSLKKTFPFIVDWDLSPGYDEYTYQIYINLYMDFESLSEYSGFELSSTYYRSLPIVDKTQLSIFFKSDSFDDRWVFFKNLNTEINSEIQFIFENAVPDELKTKVRYSAYSTPIEKTIYVDGFSSKI